MERLSDVLKRHRAVLVGAGATSSAAAGAEGAPGGDRCRLCGGIGWVRRDLPLEHPEFGRLAPCSCQLERFEAGRFSRLLRLSGLGSLEGLTFERLAEGAAGPLNPAMASAIHVARALAASRDGWLLIEGPPGSGKTRLAAALANECISQGVVVLFIPVADLLDHLRATFGPSAEIPYDELFDQVRNVPVLVLDDLGTESATPWAREKLWQLLSHRYHAGLCTVITTDVPPEALDERVRARVQDPAVCRVVRLAPQAGRQAGGLADLDLVLPHMTFDNFSPDGLGLRGQVRENLHGALSLARSFAGEPEGWLVFFGQPGCGKTHLAAAIANSCRARGDDVLFLLVPKLVDYLRSAVSQPGGGYAILDRVERAGLLVLDDFSQSFDTPWARDKLDQVLSYRSLTRMPTVITSSLAPEAMEPRIWSRMHDPALSNIYEILAPDYRTGGARAPEPPPDAGRGRGRGRGRPPAR